MSFVSKRKWGFIKDDISRNNNFAIRVKAFISLMIGTITQKSTLSRSKFKFVAEQEQPKIFKE